jgi:hypothetical protein
MEPILCQRNKIQKENRMKDEKVNLTRSSDVDDSKTNTRILNKNYSPLLVRKYQAFGWPLFVGIIVDVSLSDLDKVVNTLLKEAEEYGLVKNDLQAFRDLCGYLNEGIVRHYNKVKENCVEGVAVYAMMDKSHCSSLWGDFMVHGMCRQEFYSILNIAPHM